MLTVHIQSEDIATNDALRRARNHMLARAPKRDPENCGAQFQLDVIESLANDRQVGTTNDSLYNGANMSLCQKLQAQKMGPPEVKAEPTNHFVCEGQRARTRRAPWRRSCRATAKT